MSSGTLRAVERGHALSSFAVIILVWMLARIEASKDAVRFISDHGGKLYVWCDEFGLSQTSVSPPEYRVDFVVHHGPGFGFFQDRSIAVPEWWKVEFHHLPHHHVTAYWDGGLAYGALH